MKNIESLRYVCVKWRKMEKSYLPMINDKFLATSIYTRSNSNIKNRLFGSILNNKICFRILKTFSVISYEVPKRLGDFKIIDWIEDVTRILKEGGVVAAISFPGNQDQRLGVLLFDEKLRKCGFAKIALDDVNKVYFKNETEALKYFTLNKPKEFLISNILFNGEINNKYSLIMTVIPDQAKYYFEMKNKWKRIIEDIEGSSRTKQILQNCSWWNSFQSSKKSTYRLLPFIENNVNESIDVCAVHGDFGSGNILYYNDMFWVYDWESYDRYAPIMTDYLSYVVDHYTKYRFLTNRIIAKRILRYLKTEINHSTNINIAIALAYMSTKRSWTINDALSNSLCDLLIN